MTESEDAIRAVLAPDRTVQQRLGLLFTLRAELRGEAAVLALLEAALAEKNLELRRAFVDHAANAELTRIGNRDAYAGGFLKLACTDEEPAIRQRALGRL